MGFKKKSRATTYTPQDGDDLERIAEREAGELPITADDIAKYNWGTDDADMIQEHLRDELGCYRYDSDKNFVISEDTDTRNDLLIPEPFSENGLATDRIHTIRARRTPEPPPQFEACYRIDGVHFEFDKSFILPSVVDQLQDVEAGLLAHPASKVMIFGHTDHVGSYQYNKSLSERRAKSVYAFITNQPDIWEELYNHPNENWGTESIQYILKDLGGNYDPGPVDGIYGSQTRTAVENFQRDNGLAVDGAAGPNTRRALFEAYMSGKHDIDIGDDRFIEPKYAGCSEYNPVVPASTRTDRGTRNAENAPNRRVTFYLFNEERLPVLKCADMTQALYDHRLRPEPPAGQQKDLFRCTFYDSIAGNCDNEIGPVPPAAPALTFTSPGIDNARKTSHGAGVALNDDHDNAGTYAAGAGGGHRELEPIFDLDHQEATAAEDDLLEIRIDLQPAGHPGNVRLSAVSGGNRIRLWPQAVKGAAGDVVALPAEIPAGSLPVSYHVEGLLTGRVELETQYSSGSTNLTDRLVINVVELQEFQGGQRRIIYDYNTNIDFRVVGAPANYSFEWDLDGDGAFNTSAAETGKTTANVSVAYGPAANAGTVKLQQTAANRRQVYSAGVRMTGGLTLHVKGTSFFGGTIRGMRVALGTNQGQALPAQSTAGLHTLFAWNDNTPVRFDAVGAAHTGANRITYNGGIASNASTYFSGTGAGRRVLFVEVGPIFWTSGQMREDLVGTVNHEILHLRQHAAVRDNPPGNAVWRLLDDHYGGAGGYRDFREAEAHLSELQDQNIAWRHQLPAVQGDLENFAWRYNRCLALLAAMPAGPVRTAARQLLQRLYGNIPFFEMKRRGYQHHVRAPQ